MAKWGEGDPRWIVEERPDATNVNNWHWTEKNASNWSKDKLKELLTGLTVENSSAKCEITSLTSIEGEATVNNRKAKVIFFYEWVVKGEWSGRWEDGDKKYKGKFEIPNLSEENSATEVDVNFTVDNEKGDGPKLKEFMRTKATEKIQEQLEIYIKQLKDEYTKSAVLPTKGEQKSKATDEKLLNAKQEMSKMVINNEQTKSKSVGVKISTKTLKMTEEFTCNPPQLYRALTDKEMVQAFTGGAAIYEVEKGGRISLMNGYVTGGFVDLVSDKKIVKRWRVKSWPDAHFSTVTIELSEKNGNTVLNLTQTEVPSSEYERTLEGWKVNYWQRIRQMFGFGVQLF